MKNITTRLFVVAALFISFAGYNFIRAYDESVWFPPAAGTPPAHNVETPVNIGNDAQIKSGNLGVNTLSAIGNVGVTNGSISINSSSSGNIKITSTQPFIQFDDSDSGLGFSRILANGSAVIVQGDRNNDGSYDSPNPMTITIGATTSSDSVTFANKVRAQYYCNYNGSKCAKMEDLINLIPYTCNVQFKYDINGAVQTTVTETLTGKDVNSKFAIGIYTSRSDSYPESLVGTKYVLTNEIGRDAFDCGTYDWDDTCHREQVGYVDPLNFAANSPSIDYDNTDVNNIGNNSWGFTLSSVPLKTGSTKTISNYGHDGFGSGTIHFTTTVLSCSV
jgi:hypothetical protein